MSTWDKLLSLIGFYVYFSYCKTCKQGAQGLQASHIKLGLNESIGVKFKDISVKLCLKLWFESDWHFCNIIGMVLEATVQNKAS